MITAQRIETGLKQFTPPPGKHELIVSTAAFRAALPGIGTRQWPELRATAHRLGVFVGRHDGQFHVYRIGKRAADAVTAPAPAPAPPKPAPVPAPESESLLHRHKRIEAEAAKALPKSRPNVAAVDVRAGEATTAAVDDPAELAREAQKAQRLLKTHARVELPITTCVLLCMMRRSRKLSGDAQERASELTRLAQLHMAEKTAAGETVAFAAALDHVRKQFS